jgi:(p)ppGpp synthase/HD superfamily hydrolase
MTDTETWCRHCEEGTDHTIPCPHAAPNKLFDPAEPVETNPPISMTVAYRALQFAEHAHRTRHPSGLPHRRKYTGEPYIVHPTEVAGLVCRWGGNAFMQAAAFLHDTVEDTTVTQDEIDRVFGGMVAEWVDALTDKFTKEAHPEKNRAARKRLEAERIGGCPWQVQVIKAADLLSNTSTIVEFDPGFARRYLEEKDFLLSQMTALPALVQRRMAVSLWSARRRLESSHDGSPHTLTTVMPRRILGT